MGQIEKIEFAYGADCKLVNLPHLHMGKIEKFEIAYGADCKLVNFSHLHMWQIETCPICTWGILTQKQMIIFHMCTWERESSNILFKM